ncbi:MAG TPA: cytochrome c [Prolixibacteraceae bacterium]|nr:cytochrome c [Prolixibacteraceae bacterium]
MKKIFILILISILAACSQKVIPPASENKPVLPEKALRGEKVFMKSCNRCHPSGMSGLGPAIINKTLPGFMIKSQVRIGFGAMPSFNKDRISKEQLDDLVGYIKELSAKKRQLPNNL